ncbi:endonuclease 8-like 3 [Anguilla anguilla]|uniref:endonuclease 8-like 3 n=1 Tax=Anguilla anguilla TaxID=7936 RepID=UPI0015AD990B|nr:endonuclease 8-like 3 [Anguilla anguilla]
MVEGPGCTLNGEKIRSRVKMGQKVVEIRGSTMPTQENEPRTNPFQAFVGCQYAGVETLGKELFLFFGQRALRVHFGMNGSMRINQCDRAPGKGTPPALEVRLTSDTICFFDSTVEIRLSEHCAHKVRAMESLDVCSSKFSFCRAEDRVKNEGCRMLCDVLLDQSVLPGVGNIIKNEALFDSGLNPAVKVNQLTDVQIHHLVKMTRDFTLLFYKCRKAGSPLHKHYKVYKRPNCGQCAGRIAVCRLGEDGRMTYFCQRCQSGDAGQVNVRKLPTRNSLVGWVHSRGSGTSEEVCREEEEEWACDLCTLINKPSSRSCDACLTPRPQRPKEQMKEDFSTFSPDLIKYPCNAFSKPREEVKFNRRAAFGTSTLIFSDLSAKPPLMRSTPPLRSGGGRLDSGASERDLNKHNLSLGGASSDYGLAASRTPSRAPSGGEFSAPCRQPSKKMRIDRESFSEDKAPAGHHDLTRTTEIKSPEVGGPSLPSVPCCDTHRRPCVLRVVRKEGENKGRQFYACPLPQQTQCGFFEWADLHFPVCNHGKRCLMRTVLKLGPNNGCNFYVCPRGKAKQCDFFQWAEHGPGVKIIPGC